MKNRLPIVLSTTALIVAVLGVTPLGEAAAKVANIVPKAMFANNAARVDGISASRTPKAGHLVALGRNGQFPGSVIPRTIAVEVEQEGPQGPKGDKGDTGKQGVAGPQGPAGPKGDKGDQGASGLDGAQGPMGPAGVGPAGPVGPQGAAGPKGETGAAGAAGAQGPAGAKGDTGAQGAKGDTGAQGAKGDTGAQGPAGAAGSALAYALVLSNGTLDAGNSKNIGGVTLVSNPAVGGGGIYCFSLGFQPKVVVASAKSAGATGIVATAGDPDGLCPATHKSAYVIAYGAKVPLNVLFN